eukprot:2797390-Rhodomonas_salina.2
MCPSNVESANGPQVSTYFRTCRNASCRQDSLVRVQTRSLLSSLFAMQASHRTVTVVPALPALQILGKALGKHLGSRVPGLQGSRGMG